MNKMNFTEVYSFFRAKKPFINGAIETRLEPYCFPRSIQIGIPFLMKIPNGLLGCKISAILPSTKICSLLYFSDPCGLILGLIST